MQMPTCLLYLLIMEISQFTFVMASPFGTSTVLLEIYLYVVPHKMQANNFKF